MNESSKISNVEWGLVIGALLMVDVFQIILNLAGGLGTILNRFIDIYVGLSLGFYLQWRGISMVNPKRLAGLLGTFALEMIPVVDSLPLWCLDGILNMVMSKSDKIISKLPGGQTVQEIAGQMSSGGGSGSLNKQIQAGTEQVRNLNQDIQNRER
ncbi:MAG: hypothetical protein WAW92_04385 [Minisyncoccia bacterium]